MNSGVPLAVFLAVERRLTAAATASAAAALAVSVAVGFYQVLARFVLSQPSVWSEALMRTLVIWMVFLGAAAACRTGAMVSVDLLHRLSRGRGRRLLTIAIAAASLSLFGVLLWFGCLMALRVRFQVLAGLDVSIAWAYAAIPAGAAFSMLGVLGHLLDPRKEEASVETQV